MIRAHVATLVYFDQHAAFKGFEQALENDAALQNDEFHTLHSRCIRMNNMVTNLLKEGPVNDSLRHHSKAAVAIATDHASKIPPLHLLSAQRNHMVVLAGLGEHNDAIAMGEEALLGFRELLGSSHPTTVSVLRELSVIVLNRAHVSREFDEVEPLLREAATRCEDLFGEVNGETLSARMLLGQCIAAQGQLSGAKSLFRSNLAVSRAVHGDAHQFTMLAASHLATILMERRDLFEAEAILRWQLRVTTRTHGANSGQARNAALELSRCKLLAGDGGVSELDVKRAASEEALCRQCQ